MKIYTFFTHAMVFLKEREMTIAHLKAELFEVSHFCSHLNLMYCVITVIVFQFGLG